MHIVLHGHVDIQQPRDIVTSNGSQRLVPRLLRPGHPSTSAVQEPADAKAYALTLERAGPLDIVGDIDVLRRFKRHQFNAVAVGCERGSKDEYCRVASIAAPLFEQLVLWSQSRAVFKSNTRLEYMAEAREEWYTMRFQDAADDKPPLTGHGRSLASIESIAAYEQPVIPGNSTTYAFVHDMQANYLFGKYVEYVGSADPSVDLLRHIHAHTPAGVAGQGQSQQHEKWNEISACGAIDAKDEVAWQSGIDHSNNDAPHPRPHAWTSDRAPAKLVHGTSARGHRSLLALGTAVPLDVTPLHAAGGPKSGPQSGEMQSPPAISHISSSSAKGLEEVLKDDVPGQLHA